MDGLNDQARKLVQTKNVPEVLHAELSTMVTLVACEAGEVVALGAIDGAEIKRVYIEPDCQGLGIGKAVVEALEAEATQRGIVEVITDSSPSAEGFYCRLGYISVGPTSFSHGDAEFRCVRMIKRLSINKG